MSDQTANEPRGRCLSVAPGMPTDDLDATIAHYERMGFVAFRLGEDFAILERDEIALHFARKADHDPARTATWIWVSVDDPDALYAEWQAAGIERLRAPRLTDYRTWEGVAIDPAGNMMLFGREARPEDG
jgi:hypothetical protein